MQSLNPMLDEKGNIVNPISPYWTRHTGCQNRMDCFKEDVHSVPLYLDLLRTCRQIYSEAALMVYTENTFSFESQVEMLQFTEIALEKRQRQSLRSLHIHVEHRGVPLAYVDINRPFTT